ncbi:hypothetical protein D3C81_1417700 [compost metagenome]
MGLSPVKWPAFSSRPSISLLVTRVPVKACGSRRLSSWASTGREGNWLPYLSTVLETRSLSTPPASERSSTGWPSLSVSKKAV